MKKTLGCLGLLIGLIVTLIIVGIITVLIMLTALISSEDEGGSSGGNNEFYCHDDDTPNEVDMELWNDHYAKMNALSEHGDTVLKLSKERGIDPRFMTAIMTLETGWGTSFAVENYNNPGGVMDPQSVDQKEFYIYETMEEGLEYVANLIEKYIYEKEHPNIESFGAEYSPVNEDGTPVENDPNNTNKEWVPTVSEFTVDLGGSTTFCSASSGKVELVGDKAWVVPATKRITDPFSPTWRSSHGGIDVSKGPGESLGLETVSFMDGEVTKVIDFCPQAGWHSSRPNKLANCHDSRGVAVGWGNHVKIDHGNGIETLYAHLSEVNVKVGQKIKAGEVVGRIGDSGHSSAAHLHWEIYNDGIKHNPFLYLEEFNINDDETFIHNYNKDSYHNPEFVGN